MARGGGNVRVKFLADTKGLESGSQRAAMALDHFNVAVGNSAHETKTFGNAVKLVKFPAMVTGAGLAAQALSSLAAGGVAAGAALAPLSGAVAAYPSLLSAAAQGLGVFKLAFNGVTEALSGNKKAFDALTPRAQQFVKVLTSYKPLLTSLQITAQKGLFPGLSNLLSMVLRSGSAKIKSLWCSK